MFKIVIAENNYLSGEKGGGYPAPGCASASTVVDIDLPPARLVASKPQGAWV